MPMKPIRGRSTFRATTRAGCSSATLPCRCPSVKRAAGNSKPASEEPEIHLDGGCHRHRLTVFAARLEFPLTDGFEGVLIQPETDSSHYPRLVCAAVGTDHHLNHRGPFQFGSPGFLRILR